MKKLFVATLIALLCAFALPVESSAEFGANTLNRVATFFAQRPVIVKCRTEVEDNTLSWAWGYVEIPTRKQNYTVMVSEACLGALAIDNDVDEISDYYKVVGASVLVHESFHLRDIKNNENEAITECRAMRNYDITLIALGAEPETVERLMPLIVLDHYIFVRENPAYNLEGCKYPERYVQYGITNP